MTERDALYLVERYRRSGKSALLKVWLDHVLATTGKAMIVRNDQTVGEWPMGIAGCYVLNLHCDSPIHDRGMTRNAQFTGANEREALKNARAAGWFVRPVMDPPDCMCPHCRRRT